jgi:hypothetical protein
MERMASARVAALLASASAALVLAIEYTYGRHFRTVVPQKMERMHIRGLFYVLLLCTGVLWVIWAYLEARASLA